MNARAPLVGRQRDGRAEPHLGPHAGERPFGAGIEAFGVAGDRERRPPARRHVAALLAVGRAGVFAVALDVRGLERPRSLPPFDSLVPANGPAVAAGGVYEHRHHGVWRVGEVLEFVVAERRLVDLDFVALVAPARRRLAQHGTPFGTASGCDRSLEEPAGRRGAPVLRSPG